MFWKRKIVVTHNGRFHADEVFAVATLNILHKGCLKVIRSRDPKVWKKGDYVVDVGQVYDSKTNHFDHHQKGGAGVRENGVPYASFGLVWKNFGVVLAGDEEAASQIDKMLVQGIDVIDNGISELNPRVEKKVSIYDVSAIISMFNQTWKEEVSDKKFFEAIYMAEKVLARMIERENDEKEGKILVKKYYEDSSNKKIIILEKQFLPWESVLNKKSEPLFVIEPNSNGGWKVKTVRDNPDDFKNRKDLPEAWAGKADDELQKISEVDDAIFCHNARFIVTAKSKQGAIALAQKAIDA